jgi:DNA-binding NarL/FixJ family response regulator
VNQRRVLLADDHRVVSEGLSRLLSQDFDLVGIVEDGRALVNAARKLQPDVIVAEISMPYLNGLEAMAVLKKERPDVKVVFLTMHQEPAYARRALEGGAAGFVLKHSTPAELVMAIQAALKGQTFITPALADSVLRRARHEPRDARDAVRSLTPRKREILQLLAEGNSAKQVAAKLAISSRTVEFHKYQIMESHGLHSNADLIHFAIKYGIVTI